MLPIVTIFPIPSVYIMKGQTAKIKKLKGAKNYGQSRSKSSKPPG